MSLQVNFSTHSKAIQASYKAILDGDDSINWVVYGYDKGTNDLKVLAQGNDGLEELTEEFNDGKIQYAFARVIDPNTELSKFVLISWCGSGVPESRKGLFNSHLDDVSRFLKGYHVQINARSESDVDPSYIMKRVNESSGSKYSIHKEAPRPVEKPTPVNSVYKRTEIPDIAAMQRAAMQKEPAPAPVNSVYQRTLTAPKPLGQRWGAQQQQQEQEDRERIEREATDRAAREREERERDQRSRVDQDRLQRQRDEQAQRQREQDEESERQRKQQEDERRRKQQEESEMRKRQQKEEEESERRRQQDEEESERQRQQEESDMLRKQQADEEEKLYNQQAEEEERARYEAEEQARIQQEQADREREEERQRQEQQLLEEELNVAAARAAAAAEQNAKAIVEPKGTLGAQNAVVLFAYDAAEANEMSLIEGEFITNIEQVDEGWWTATSKDGTRSGLFPANYVQLLEESAPSEIVPETIAELEVPEIPEVPEVPAVPLEDQGQTAVALYEYIAAEDNEITFRENDIITQIEFASDDWWQGTAPNGLIGLFPSNYVELRQ